MYELEGVTVEKRASGEGESGKWEARLREIRELGFLFVSAPVTRVVRAGHRCVRFARGDKTRRVFLCFYAMVRCLSCTQYVYACLC